jgi:polysaccharide pyruvyl transferase CsaB
MTDVKARLLLSGYYGFGNFGDEAILRVFVDEWRKRRPGDEICVLSANPPQTVSTFGVDAVPRMSPHAVGEAIRRAHVLVSGGGGLLQTATSLRSLLYYTGIIREAKRAGRKAVIFGAGIGPLDFIGKQIVRRACADVDMAIVRDAASAALLQPLLPRVTVEVAADPVFLASKEVTPATAALLEREGLANVDERLVAVIVRKSALLDRVGAELSAGIDKLSQERGAHVIFVPMQRPHDAEAAIEVIRRCKSAPTLLGGGYDLPVMTALVSRCAAVVSMRLHALILAARMGIPFLPIPYDPKVTALSETLAYPLPPLERRASGPALFDRLWKDREKLASHLAGVVPPVAARAGVGFDRLAELAEGGQVAPDLRRVDVRVVRDLLRGDALLAHLPRLRQDLEVTTQSRGDANRQPIRHVHSSCRRRL